MKTKEALNILRVIRLFQSSVGKLINTGVNGAINIARKVFSDCFVKSIIDSGSAFLPIKVNIF